MTGEQGGKSRPGPLRLCWRVCRCLLLGWLTLVIGAHLMGDRLLFIPPSRPASPPQAWVGDIALYLHGELDGGTPVLLHCHGNAEIADDLAAWASELVAAGLSVLIVEYPGYGASPGRPSAAGASRSARAAYDWLIDQGVAAERIVVHGRSVGGGPAAALAAEVPIAGLILESTFVAPSRVLLRPPLIPFDPYPVRRQLRRLHRPVAVLHGSRDQVIPVWHGRALAAAAVHLLAFHEEPAADHNDLSLVMDRYAERLAAWAWQMIDTPEGP